MIAYILLFLTVVIWGWSFVATKLCLGYLTPLELMGIRFVVGLPIMIAIVRARNVKFEFNGRWRGLILGSIILTAHILIQITGIKYTSATNTGWLVAVIPLITAVLAFFILREKISRNAITGIVVATVGIFLLISKGELTGIGWLSSVGDWLVLISAHTWALYTIVTRDLSRDCNPLAVTAVILIGPTIVSAVSLILFADMSKFLNLPTDAFIALLFLTILGTAVAHWFWQEGVARIGAARAAIFLYLIPLATTGLAVPYLGESFGLFTALGGILVLFGVWIAQRKIVRDRS
ncbi:MAG: DMT family transporter [candidate division Zixibacteria bacterium]|nr:DMT family transporter [candidate division Zixibacteria bacterium]